MAKLHLEDLREVEQAVHDIPDDVAPVLALEQAVPEVAALLQNDVRKTRSWFCSEDSDDRGNLTIDTSDIGRINLNY